MRLTCRPDVKLDMRNYFFQFLESCAYPANLSWSLKVVLCRLSTSIAIKKNVRWHVQEGSIAATAPIPHCLSHAPHRACDQAVLV
jgi:hypothetical protein